MARGVGAAYTADALLNAPQILGSLDLVFNPTGGCPSEAVSMETDQLHSACTSQSSLTRSCCVCRLPVQCLGTEASSMQCGCRPCW